MNESVSVLDKTSIDKESPPSAKARHLPGEEGVWVFILGDMMIFGLFFLVFIYYRGQAPELFTTSQATLNLHYGAINTLFLLTSSWFIALGLHALRRNRSQDSSKLLLLAGSCGLGFIVVKFLEYGETHFMEMATAPIPLRAIFEVSAVAVYGAILLLYLGYV